MARRPSPPYHATDSCPWRRAYAHTLIGMVSRRRRRRELGASSRKRSSEWSPGGGGGASWGPLRASAHRNRLPVEEEARAGGLFAQALIRIVSRWRRRRELGASSRKRSSESSPGGGGGASWGPLRASAHQNRLPVEEEARAGGLFAQALIRIVSRWRRRRELGA